jgi:LPPG:FO 2-phospho-L-lactate transferase
VGAARFLRGLCSLPDAGTVTIIVNTGDDETFFGLHVSPDLDTVTYTLAGRVDPLRGWGIRTDSFRCLEALSRYYGPAWFRLGDADLATHLYRTDLLRRGKTLTHVTAQVAARHGVKTHILPMSNDRVRTIVHVEKQGPLPFQEYLVKRRARGGVERVIFSGLKSARPAPGVLAAIRRATALIIPPSNPIVSILPILSLPGVRSALRATRATIAAISPLVAGRPIKGPLDRILSGLGHEVSAVGVARIYRDFVDLFVLDRQDAALVPRIEALGMKTLVTDTIMKTPGRSVALARAVLRAVEEDEQ